MNFIGLDLVRMNETDVREAIIRPWLHNLGYAYGTEAHIRTEVPLIYDRTFLGRKNARKDSPLRRRAHYVLDVFPVGRWIVEVKAPSQELTLEDAQQAHTYAAHPEIAAFVYLITNGRLFRLYQTSQPSEPALEWTLDQMGEKAAIVSNVIGPEAIRKRVQRAAIDTEKPLASGLGSRARIVGGFLVYVEHVSPNPQMVASLRMIAENRATVTGREVIRAESGLISGELTLLGPYDAWDALNRAAGLESYKFQCGDEYISVDKERPSIFKGWTRGSTPAGTSTDKVPGFGSFKMPFATEMLAYTEATGFLEGEFFRGTFRIDYDLRAVLPPQASMLSRMAANQIKNTSLKSNGTFEIRVM